MREPDDQELSLPPRARLAVLSRVSAAPATACQQVVLGARDDPLLLWLGGASAVHWRHEPWPRVWGLRGLLYVWDDAVTPTVLDCLGDAAWRVREMAAKVTALRELPGAESLVALLEDDLPRVRAAGVRALGAVGEAEHADAVLEALEDGDVAVRRAAAVALARLEVRLDRRLS